MILIEIRLFHQRSSKPQIILIDKCNIKDVKVYKRQIIHLTINETPSFSC